MPVGVGLVPCGVLLQPTIIDFATVGDHILIAADTDPLRIYKLFLVVGGAVALTFQYPAPGGGGSVPLAPALTFTANGASMTLPFDSQPWFSVPGGSGFILNLSANVQVSGVCYATRQVLEL